MSQPSDPSRDLLFGLLALQNGLIDQGALFAAFAAWTRDKGRPLADHLVDLGHLDAPRRAAVEAIAGRARPGARRRRREEPRRPGRRTLDSRKPRAGRRPRGRGDPRARRLGAGLDPTTTMTPTAPAATPWARPPPTASGSASCGLMPGAAWAPSSWRSTPSCTARSPSSRSSTTTPTTPISRQRFVDRGRDHRRAGAPRHRPGLRPGHLRRRPAVLRDAVHPGRLASRRRSTGSTPTRR